MFGLRRCKNLKDQANIQATKPKKDSNSNTVAHLYPCKTKNCRYCPNIDHSRQITSKTQSSLTAAKSESTAKVKT